MIILILPKVCRRLSRGPEPGPAHPPAPPSPRTRRSRLTRTARGVCSFFVESGETESSKLLNTNAAIHDAQRVRARPRSRSPEGAERAHTHTVPTLYTDSCFLSACVVGLSCDLPSCMCFADAPAHAGTRVSSTRKRCITRCIPIMIPMPRETVAGSVAG